MTSIVIDDGITGISPAAFAYLKEVTDVVIPDSLIWIMDYSFVGCEKLTSIRIPDGIIGISDCAFSGTGIKELKIPNTIKECAGTLIIGCPNIESIEFPDVTKYYSAHDFAGCTSLKYIKFSPNLESYSPMNRGDFYFYSGDKEVTLPKDLAGYEFKIASNGKIVRHSEKESRVIFVLDGGSGSIPTDFKMKEGEEYEIPEIDMSKAGSVFKGWSSSSGSNYKAGDWIVMGSDDITLTAVWEEIPIEYSITYDLGGGTGTVPTQESLEEGQSFEVTDIIPTRSGYTFNGWSDGEGIVNHITF